MKCYLCDGSGFVARKGSVRDEPFLRILECTGCGLVALGSQEHVAAGHFADSGMHGASAPTMEQWLRSCEQDDQRRFEMLAASLANRRVLDFGCGAGGFLRKARTIAADAAGVEPERRVRDYWRDEAAFHVIEHLPDPRATLKDLAARLGRGGRLVVEVPSSDDALLTLYDNQAFQGFTYWSQHLYLFNAQTLRQLIVQAGLRVAAIQQFQRYSLANHLHWLSHGQPGGHQHWTFLDTPELMRSYAAALAALGRCDTIIAYVEAS